MNKILLLLFHPRLESSRVNLSVNQFLTRNKQIKIKDMYELYPDFNINVKTEQQDLLEADVILFQHPFYWYSAPPLVKQWIDLVLENGWAYGRGGEQLKGKKIMHIISSGGGFVAYSKQGKNLYTYNELLRPFELTYRLCQLEKLPPYIIPNAYVVTTEELDFHTQRLSRFIEEIGDSNFDFSSVLELDYLNQRT